MQLLFKFGTGAPAVRTQLCLAIAALAAHLPAAQWGEGGVLRWLMDKFSGQDPAMAMSCMLELLTVLPQVWGCCSLASLGAARLWCDGFACTRPCVCHVLTKSLVVKQRRRCIAPDLHIGSPQTAELCCCLVGVGLALLVLPAGG
jgi:transportin-3